MYPVYSRGVTLIWTCWLLGSLSSCGGGDAQVTQNPAPPPVDNNPVTYTGPVAATSDVQQFKLALWDNISSKDRCGACHLQAQQNPHFARNDDINLAYSAANALVNLSQPEDSVLVSKVAGGHNCWLSSNAACADIMRTWISNWANVDNAANQIQLEAPLAKEPGANKNFPADSALFADSLHPLLTNFCASCHTNSATIPISPYFASSDVQEAYDAAKSRIDLDNPANSRFVGRLRNEFHNCWSDCNDNANALVDAIQQMSDAIDTTLLDPALINSKALTLFEGTLATGGGRFEKNLIAKWEFKTGSGSTAFDTSGVEPAIDLNLNGQYNWLEGWGIQFSHGKAQGSTSSSKKLYDLITATGEFSLEAWLVPANVTQEGPARIISYSGGTQNRNFTLGQTLYNYDALLRNSVTDTNGEPALSTADADEDLQASLQHVVMNYDPINGRQIYVNGVFSDDQDTSAAGDLLNWNSSYAFVLGSEVSGEFSWAGAIRMVAIHNRALQPEQIAQNFSVGIGQKFFLLFDVSALSNMQQSYIVFETSLYDSYSYLFSAPFFISLDDNSAIDTVPLKGMRIGINGREANVGQVFVNMQSVINQDDYVAGQGQSLSRLGTIIPLEKGPQQDEFFLTFEQLGEHTHVSVEANPPAPAQAADTPLQAEIGTRHFAEIHASMASLTGVSPSNAAVKAAFEQLKQQLPAVTKLDSFVAANQMAITQLAIKYCDQLVETDSLRSAYFSGFDFNLPASDAFDSQDRSLIYAPLINNMVGQQLADQPQQTALVSELDSLLERLTVCSGSNVCDASYTKTVVKALCAATLGSAVVTVQ